MTCCATAEPRRRHAGATLLLVPFVLSLALAACGGVDETNTSVELLINPRLGPQLAQWLVGPVSRLATPAEVDSYLALSDEAAARDFIDRFWALRNPYPLRPDNVLRETFERRAAEADKRYSEAGYLGRRTARGTVYVLYGDPAKVDHQLSSEPRDPPIEVWLYGADAPPGLDGQKPQRQYRFIKRGDVTEFYTPARFDPRPRRPGEGF